jgi:hypothetical protein
MQSTSIFSARAKGSSGSGNGGAVMVVCNKSVQWRLLSGRRGMPSEWQLDSQNDRARVEGQG